MLIDCDTCTARGTGCADCVVTVLLGAPPGGVELAPAETAAIAALSGAGLVPPLRLVSAPPHVAEPCTPRSSRPADPSAPRRAAGFD